MSLAALAGVFGLIFVLELPDKTLVATVVMSARARPRAVFAGASVAFVVHMAIAALAGGLLTRLPHTPKELVVGLLFLGGAGYLLFVPEKHEQREGTLEGEAEMRASAWREAVTAFSVIFVGEFGDLTQIQAANIVARTHQPLEVFVAASLALMSVAALGSFAGQSLVRIVPLARVRLVGGLIFAGLGAYTLISLAAS
jgi:putative Ca2+/H+ antiporter (TMEM165/GDT1 family)